MSDERKPEERPRRGPRSSSAGVSSGADKAAAVTGKKQYFRRKKVCKFCVEKIDNINYKEVNLLRGFVAERGRIIPRRISGVCTPHQRLLTDAIKKARNIALLPFAAEL
jgi:small subunit ribosomal protein S18